MMMSAAILPSDLQRSEGKAAISFKKRGSVTVLDRLYQEGCAKFRLPRTHQGRCPEAVLLNTAGGLTGGDRFDLSCRWQQGTTATVTTQAAERVYRSLEGTAEVFNVLKVEPAASAHWLPQETILFDGGAVNRRFEARLGENAQLVAVESWMIGRQAMGEIVSGGIVTDHMRIWQDEKLIFADTLRLNGDIQRLLRRPAVAGGHLCFATMVVVSKEVSKLYQAISPVFPCSVMEHVLVSRLVSGSMAQLRESLRAAIGLIDEAIYSVPIAVPHVWRC